MGITWRDGVNTVLAGLVGAIGLAVTGEWGWPLLGSYRSGTVALGIVGIAMCSFSGWGTAAATERPGRGTVAVGSVLGGLALVLIVAGVIVGSELLFMALAVDTLALWLIATIRHALVGTAGPSTISPPTAAG
jgi:hypothetical protein